MPKFKEIKILSCLKIVLMLDVYKVSKNNILMTTIMFTAIKEKKVKKEGAFKFNLGGKIQ
jgi:hypothetical protein